MRGGSDAAGALLHFGIGQQFVRAAGRAGAQWVHEAAVLVAGPVTWTERWIARAQRKADLRDARFRRHEEGVRAGTEPPGLLDRMESWITLFGERSRASALLAQAYANERLVNGKWPLAARPDDGSPGLAEAWRTWVMDGPVRGPDGVEITIWVRSAGQDLPFHDPPDDQAWVTWEDPAESRTAYTVCVRRKPAGPARDFYSFATEISARWYAVELARTVRQAGFTGLRPWDLLPERSRPARSERILASEITGLSHGSDHGSLRLSQRARARWRRIRTGRQ